MRAAGWKSKRPKPHKKMWKIWVLPQVLSSRVGTGEHVSSRAHRSGGLPRHSQKPQGNGALFPPGQAPRPLQIAPANAVTEASQKYLRDALRRSATRPGRSPSTAAGGGGREALLLTSARPCHVCNYFPNWCPHIRSPKPSAPYSSAICSAGT